MNQKAHVACNFNYLFEDEGHLKVKGSHVNCICVNISETVQDNSLFFVVGDFRIRFR